MRMRVFLKKEKGSPHSPNDKNTGNGFEYQGADVTGTERLTKNLFLTDGVPGSPCRMKHKSFQLVFKKLQQRNLL